MRQMLTKEHSDKLIKFYGSEGKAQKFIDGHNKGLIEICPKCSKVDINVLTHPDTCDPEFENYRREDEDNAWK